MVDAKEINVTYETLFEVLKREKDLTDLQKLEETFFTDFVSYMQEKKQLLEKNDDSMFSYDERKKTEKQIENARRIIKDIYDRREKKIMTFALIKSRTKTDIMDMSTFLEHEKKLFDEMVKMLSAFRDNVANNLIVAQSPIIPAVSVFEGEAPPASVTEPQKSENEESSDSTESNEDGETKLVRFLNAVPKFVGTELEEYGPFEEEDIANLPSQIANLLLEKGKVEEIQG